jgi:glycosyltransferase involved in cell wall biosynthesis
MQKTLALVMVVKNEEKGLEQAILSAKPFVNEIVIAVDSASNDATLDIAKKYADVYKIFEFDNDFSDARNFAHMGVKSDWILFLDGHEILEKAEKLQEYLNLDCDGLLTTVKMENGTEFRNPRIYKNGVQFEGKIHERSQCKKTALCTGVVIKHNRVAGQSASAIAERDQQREMQMSTIMLQEIKENPKNLRVLFHLALWYQVKGNYHKALKYQNLFLKYSPASADRYFILYNRSLLFFQRGKLFRAFWAISRAGLAEPNRWETEKMKGLIYFARGKYEKALPCLVDSFNQNTKDYAYKPLKRDDAGTWSLIGECFYQCGIYDKASTSFGLASERAEEKKQKDFFKKRQQLMVNMLLGREN